MNYSRIYDQIITNRQNHPAAGYTEKHHIVPRCLGGSNKKSNIVALTAREHFICHMLLVKIYPKGSIEQKKMLHAVMGMKRQNDTHKRYINSRLYEYARKEYSKLRSSSQKGKGNTSYDTVWVSNPDTLHSMKISKNDKMPIGYVKGRNKRWALCITCGVKFLNSSVKCCSEKCRTSAISKATSNNLRKRPPRGFVTRKLEFMSLYSEGLSITQALKDMGYNPCCGDKRRIIKGWISGNEEAGSSATFGA